MRVVRFVVLCAFGVALAWAIVRHSYTAYVAAFDPQTALSIHTEPTALANLVERKLEEFKLAERAPERAVPGMAAKPSFPDSPPGNDRLAAWAELAAKARPKSRSDTATPIPDGEELIDLARELLRRDPLSARGFRLLGQVEEARGSSRETVARFMRMAASRSAHEIAAVWWLMFAALDDADYQSAAIHADTVLRTQSRLVEPAVQVLAKIAQTPEGMSELTTLLKTNPPWRKSFFTSWPKYLADARAPLVPLMALRETPHPPTMSELSNYMSLLMQHRFHELAYYTWLQFLPPEQLQLVTFPFNGSFEQTPSGLPFDWQLSNARGVSVTLAPRPEAPRERALRIEFGIGRIDFPPITQSMLLPAGSYHFSAAHRAQFTGRRGLVWQVACINDARTVLGATPMILGTTPSWKTFEFVFTVPETGCAAQLVRLYHDARSPSEQLITGWSFHDDVKIARKGTTPE